nr:hypothetical protein [Tanacetum cinerariifolium]
MVIADTLINYYYKVTDFGFKSPIEARDLVFLVCCCYCYVECNNGPNSTTLILNGSAIKNGGKRVVNNNINESSSSYASKLRLGRSKLSLTSSTKAYLRKIKANVPNEADYDIWLPLALVYEVNDQMNNSLYGYFIGQRFAFSVVEWFVHNNYEKLWIKEAKKKKSDGNNGGTKNFTFLVKPKTQYRPKEKRSTDGMSDSPKMTLFGCTNKALTSCYNKESTRNKGNTFSLSSSFEALNDDNMITEEVAMGSIATT